MNTFVYFNVILNIINVIFNFSYSNTACGWGERGHQLIAKNAALLVNDFSQQEEIAKGLNRFFQDRSLQLGHLANIPDTSWREVARQSQEVIGANGPTHFWDIELSVDIPPPIDLHPNANKNNDNININPFLTHINKMSFEPFSLFKFPSKIQSKKFEAGSNPWRIEELYKNMVQAFACAHRKEPISSQNQKPRELWKLPLISSTHIPSSSHFHFYQCSAQQSRQEALWAAVAMGGVMGHFVGDLAQPFHTTVNYDGWLTQNGKIHEYFEIDLVDAYDSSLEGDILNQARTESVKQLFIEIMGEIGSNTMGTASASEINSLTAKQNQNNKIGQILFALAINSWKHIDEALKLDNKFAQVQSSQNPEFRPSSAPSQPSDQNNTPPHRKEAHLKEVNEAFKPLILQRLAIGSRILAWLWHQAWVEGGKPNLNDMNAYSLPYLVDVPFLWPSYDFLSLKKFLTNNSRKWNKNKSKKGNASGLK